MRTSYTVVFEQGDDGITVTVPSLPGLVTCGDTLEEARQMATDAIRCHLESLRIDNEPIPKERKVEVETVEIEIPAA